ncbi:HpcH/HpaI aldolase/citrate lyase family protein [Rhizobium sp. B230/85]|uniref:aldolase/citrate lyase family protein n=1 Tax=unclassified Rhizobium TaxID=2613769 RepID=UPI001AD9866F|nr:MULTISPECIES: HpcH/HpaI aldolase/citrate lyase family protein [unclassified Rhizobium]MBO9133329.1 HpcH/HpaI aldolase/citrate lyase family protein [Rhizobium sp. B209b/85]QXZ97481.1 HpcH/HpaI aldolase/citrate lyase family protein [Rhizobium sp. B230/85]
MTLPPNAFKIALRERRPQIGLWVAMADAYAAEIAGHAGFDWLVLDGEHGPNDLRSIMAQLQALQASPSEPVVRLPTGASWMIKQFFDIGARTLLIPMVDSAEQAAELVRAVRYPPDGIRGMGAGIGRASRFNTVAGYVADAGKDICLLVQAETRAALADLERIAGVEGIDGIFIGPADLAADLGFPGNLEAPEVQAAIEAAIATIVKAGKPAGILTFNETLNRRYLGLGATFVAVGADVTEFSTALQRLRRRYGPEPENAEAGPRGY